MKEAKVGRHAPIQNCPTAFQGVSARTCHKLTVRNPESERSRGSQFVKSDWKREPALHKDLSVNSTCIFHVEVLTLSLWLILYVIPYMFTQLSPSKSTRVHLLVLWLSLDKITGCSSDSEKNSEVQTEEFKS